ncbi:MAG: diguanylate cyclase [Candidatus Scalindua sp. AMX11]|nr:MAG: diguanylate cyclase [Candidatus Scalindua sp.]NOG82429.1 diguanylate cyclase [Planctomycetota bacterium]RZV70216.1 MAG: diguanylate cyclase [Candidatus Scalindua sp. SCAELEC01]TDE64073.1 MAG: diguanylate cyclase [Candidatus Scalindua sp. AMX11]GJQ60102.1 MAG: diguanylate cyclase response regulator [Candidatus Scalindua sp.]
MNHKVLFVDDEPNILMSYNRMLKKLFCIETALGGEQGLRKVNNGGAFSVVVSDLQMPVMNGLQFLSSVKGIMPDCACIILTGKADLNKAIEAVNQGNIFRFLTKPCEPETLIAAINDGIEYNNQSLLERELNKKNLVLAITDALTGCLNRTYMDAHLTNEIKRARRYRHSFSVIMCDIDDFKKINDTYGHVAGDEVLKLFAQSIKSTIRKDLDWLVRYGGEEFLLVLPEIGIEGATILAERLCKDLAQKTIKIKDQEIQITASFGLAGFAHDTPQEKTSPEFLITAADALLYQAKTQGKNRVVVQ